MNDVEGFMNTAMVAIWCCVAVLFLATIGWVEVADSHESTDTHTVCLAAHHCGQESLVYASDPTPCLTKMEAAMRAMEPFVSTPQERYSIGLDDLVVHLDTQQDALRKEIARLDQRDRAWSQWVTVKNTCWRQP